MDGALQQHTQIIAALHVPVLVHQDSIELIVGQLVERARRDGNQGATEPKHGRGSHIVGHGERGPASFGRHPCPRRQAAEPLGRKGRCESSCATQGHERADQADNGDREPRRPDQPGQANHDARWFGDDGERRGVVCHGDAGRRRDAQHRDERHQAHGPERGPPDPLARGGVDRAAPAHHERHQDGQRRALPDPVEENGHTGRQASPISFFSRSTSD